MGTAVRIVFDTLYYSVNAILVAFEVNESVVLLVTTAYVASSNSTSIIAATCFGFLFQQTGMRFTLVQPRGLDRNDKATAG